MKCRDFHNNLILFIEDDLPRNQMNEMTEHLNDCKECKVFTDEMKAYFKVIQLEKQVQVSPFFYTRLKARMENELPESSPGFGLKTFVRILQPALYSLLLGGGILAGILTGRYAGQVDSSSAPATVEIVPFFNEMDKEPLETFLMD